MDTKNVLLATNHKSFGYQYVDYFINEDNKAFNETIQHILPNKDVVNNYQGHDRDDSGLLYNLSTWLTLVELIYSWLYMS